MSSPTFSIGSRVDDEPAIPPSPWESRREKALRDQRNNSLDRRGDPVEIPFDGHKVVQGSTGSGKTQRAGMTIIDKLLKPFVIDWKDKDGKMHVEMDRPHICHVDFAGSTATSNGIDYLCKKHKVTKHTFHTDPSKSEPYDLLQGIKNGMSVNQAANMLVSGAGHGGVTGKSSSIYFLGQAMIQAIFLIQWVVGRVRGGANVAMADADKFLDDPANQEKDGNQIRASIKQLAAFPQLATSERGIEHAAGIANRDFHQFILPTLGEAQTSVLIGTIVIENLVAVARHLCENVPEHEWGKPNPRIYLIIDEAQMVGHCLADLLSQSRKYGIVVILLHQTSSQWKNVDPSLLDIVRDNTTTKIYFTCTTPDEVRALQGYSKQGIDYRKSRNLGGGLIASGGRNAASESESEYLTPLTDLNRILDTSATDGEAYVISPSKDGHKEPIRTFIDFTFTEEEYLRQLTTPIRKLTKTAHATLKKSPEGDSVTPSWEKNHLNRPGKERERHLENVALMLKKIRSEASIF